MKITIDTTKKELTLHEKVNLGEVFRILLEIGLEEIMSKNLTANEYYKTWSILPAKEESTQTINKWVAPVMPAPYNPCPSTTPNLPNGWPNKVTC